MSKRITIKSAATILFCVLAFDANAEPVSVIGPLEAVKPDGRAIVILGQTYKVDAKDFSSVLAMDNSVDQSTHIPPLGTFVAVQGDRNSNGDQIATTVRIVRSRYVPGASDVYLLGVAATYDATLAVAEMGGVQVFLGDINGGHAQSLAPGALVELVGRQSHPGGPVWAAAYRVVRAAPVVSAEAGVAESSLQSITGRGVTIQSITGTGVSAQSITGTGASLQSITGTGISAQSITGTGASLQSITGTGISAQSITGTGASLQSITGTGISAQSITGTGIRAQSITGTGASTQSITGTGVRTQSITGTGASN
ncbi:MAG TPA: hypothetical protein VFU13_17280 [Steroidobacteraceae bacterium]|nr:hypothetical protein [Steroidobacteraceae bacterium]